MKSSKKDQVSGTFLSEKEEPVSAKGLEAASQDTALSKASEALFENGFSQAAGVVLPDGRIVEANAGFCEKFNLPGEIQDQNLLNFLSAGDRRLLARKLLLAQHNGNSCTVNLSNSKNRQQVKWQIRAANGTLYLKEELPQANVPPPVTHSPAVDLAQLELIPLPALLYNRRHKLLLVNQKFTEFSGKSYAELSAEPSAEGFLAAHIPQLEELRATLLDGSEKEVKCRVQLNVKESEKRWVEYSEKVLPAGSLPAVPEGFSIAVLYDIEELIQKEEMLKSRQEEVNLFMDRASHDLKGPLKSMMSLHQIIEYEFGRDATIMEYVRHYHTGISRLYRILQDMLQLSRLSKAEPSLSRVNLMQMVEECLHSFRNLPRFFDISFTKQMDIPAEVLLEESLLQTIVQNLLENAIKYCAEEKPEVRILIREEGNGIRLEVSDNGIGIPAELQPRVFDRYFRATSQASGSGLGLYLLKQAVNKLKGEVNLQSSEGVGTTFIVCLPYTTIKPAPAS